MTDFGRRAGEMLKSVYDTDADGVVDNSAKLDASTKAQVQDHTPKTHAHAQADITNLATALAAKAALTHTHLEADVTDLLHDAQKIKGVVVDDGDKADGKVLAFNSTSGNLEYETPTGNGDTFVDRGDHASDDWVYTDFTRDGNFHELDCTGKAGAGAKAILLKAEIKDNSAGKWFLFCKNGNSNIRNSLRVTTQVPDVFVNGYGFVACDANLKLQYKTSVDTFTDGYFNVCGWIV